MAQVKFYTGTSSQYSAITPDANTFYLIDGVLYLGTEKLSNNADLAAALSRISANESEISLLQQDSQKQDETINRIDRQVNDLDDKFIAFDRTVDSRVNSAIASVVDGAPETFDTLKEIADWIETDKTGTAALTAKVNQNINDIAAASLSKTGGDYVKNISQTKGKITVETGTFNFEDMLTWREL